MAWQGTLIADESTVVATRPARWGSKSEAIRDMVLANPHMTQSEVAAKVGTVRSNVSQVMTRFLASHNMGELGEFQADKANIYDAIQLNTLASITPDKMAKASYSQLVVGAAILEDKARLVRGQPTSLHVNVLMDVAELIRRQDD